MFPASMFPASAQPFWRIKRRGKRAGPSALEQEDAQLFPIVHQQTVLGVVRHVVAEPLPHTDVPRGSVFALQRLLYRLRRLFVVLRGAAGGGGAVRVGWRAAEGFGGGEWGAVRSTRSSGSTRQLHAQELVHAGRHNVHTLCGHLDGHVLLL